ncbi:MAG: DNA replication/repair protein RecF [Bacteroidia bacterium]|jgi:DNA replication and repair protein RecF|nr:DNA replication/repair protein RecF [Bacteroidia bacterium]
MHLSQLHLLDFKNCKSAGLTLSGRINCFIGNNGAGKTNLLDSIHYLSYCKSYFNPQDQQNIRNGSELFSINGTYANGSDAVQVQCIQRRNQKKSFRYEKKEVERLADHIGRIPLVMVSPYDRDLINDGSELRRRFLDSMISQFDPLYLDALIRYNKALLQRNALLRNTLTPDESLLGIWESEMIPAGTLIHERRKAFVEEYVPGFRQYYARLSGSAEEAGLEYESTLSDRPFEIQLRESLERDRQLRFTTRGIHRDDLQFLLNGLPLKKFGSQGQQKSFAIALKLAQFEHTALKKNMKPILLLDDIFDKLDDRRVQFLINLVSGDLFGQVFITDTQPQRIMQLFTQSDIEHKIFYVHDGVVVSWEEHLKNNE